MNTTEIIKALRKKLSLLRRREFLFLLLERILPIVAGIAVVIFFNSLLEIIFRFSKAGRGILLTLILLCSAGIAVYFFRDVVLILIGKDRKFDDEHLAKKVGQILPGIKDRLLNTLQLSHIQMAQVHYSAELIELSIQRAGTSYLGEDFTKAASIERVRVMSRYAIPLLIAVLFPVLMFPHVFGGALERITNPGRDFPVENPFNLTVIPGNTSIVRGTPFTIQARTEGQKPDLAKIFIQEEGTSSFSVVIADAREDTFQYHFEKVTVPFRYYVQGTKKILFRPDHHVNSPLYAVKVIQRPVIRHLKVRLESPPYSGLSAYYLAENIGDITALKGTAVTMEITTNKRISTAFLHFDKGMQVPLEFKDTSGKGSFTLLNDGIYTIHLIDQDTVTNEAPIEYHLTLLRDEFPFIQVIHPGRDTDLDESMTVPLLIRVMDDYGLTKVHLISQKAQTKENREGSSDSTSDFSDFPQDTITVPLLNRKDRMQDIQFDWDLSKTNLVPDDRVSYYFEVYDNDVISGPKKSASEKFYVRFPSMEEIFSRVEEQQETGINTMEEVLKENKDIQEKLQEITREMKRNPNLNWDKQKALKNAADRQAESMKKIEDVQKRYEEILDKLEKHDLTSLETLKKYAELQQLFQEVLTPELQKAVQDLQKSLQEQSQQNPELQKQVEKFAFSQEEYLKKIERTLNLLKRIQTEQKMDEMVKQAEELAKKQETINKELEKVNQDEKKSMKELAKQEEELGFKTNEVDEKVKELARQMAQDSTFKLSRLESAARLLEEQQVIPRMQEMSTSMQNGEKSEPKQEGEKLEKDLQDYAKKLESARDEMKSNEKRKVMTAMRRTLQDVLELSKQQEQLAGESKNLTAQSPKFQENAEKQANVMSGLSRIAQQLLDLSQMTFFVTPQMGKSIGGAMTEMQSAVQSLENRNGEAASMNQEQAMGALNESAKMMTGAMQQMQGAQSVTGMEEYMKMLQQMAGAQEGINDETEQSMMGGKPKSSQQGALLRLAREQMALQKILEELQKQIGERQDILGSLDQIGKDMGDVVKELEEAQVNRKTIERQRQILSRLLDAQRSLQRRDYSKKRQSETAKDYRSLPPPELSLQDLNKPNQLQEELLKALQEGYTKDFIDLIKKYYEALERTKAGNSDQ